MATIFYHSLWFCNYLAKRVYDLIWVANVLPLSFPPLFVISGGKKIVHKPVIIPYLQCLIWMPSEMWQVEPYVDLITLLSWWLIPTLPSHRIINKDGRRFTFAQNKCQKKCHFLPSVSLNMFYDTLMLVGKCNEIEV